MTVGELIALLANISDHNLQVVFKDPTGTPRGVVITQFGQIDHISPPQPSDPAYVQIQETPDVQ